MNKPEGTPNVKNEFNAPRRAVVLLSGGLDSTTLLAMAKAQGFEAYALSFDYGQRHKAELKAAANVARQMGAAQHLVARLDPQLFTGSALTNPEMDVPKDRPEAHMAEGIPNTYVPARNTIFLSFALGWAEVLQANAIFIGVNALDYSGYPDCRPEYIAAYEKMANLATKSGVEGQPLRIHTPLIHLTKAQIVAEGLKLGVDYAQTVTCYDPKGEEGAACGHCDACQLRMKGFRENGMEDPAPYAS